ncbi:glycosyltransferase family 4 protein [Clostridium baratii]|uniref:glycosyltransferase family 4 protein n=1 Tax=Clostridium baratii TaxID=1561 RepID=UPI003D32DA04
MKIGIDGRAAEWYRGTGIGTYTYQLITSLNSVDAINDYLIFTPDNKNLKNLNDNFTIQKVDTIVKENFWDNVNVPNILSNSNMELYHVPQNGVGLSNNVNCKKVITLHDIIPLRMPETVSDRYLRIFNDEMPGILKNCDGIITVSEFSKKDISEEFNYPLDKIFVTPLAAEPIYKPMSKCSCKQKLKVKYGLTSDFILYVGGFSPRKNILGLIEAFALIPKIERKTTKLVIIGKKGPSYDIYLKRARQLKIEKDIIFTGFVPLEDLPIFYNASEMLVYPSFYEGFGLPPIEAMACGTPVITSNVTSIPEVCYNSAILVDPKNTDELAFAMKRVLNDSLLVLTMVKKAIVRSRSFSWRKTAINTVKAYESILR